MIKPSCKKMRAFILDESMATKEYKKYGFPNLAKDEHRHKVFLSKRLKECK